MRSRSSDDIDDLVDDEPHRPPLVREHKERLHALLLDPHVFVDQHQRHELTAILHHQAAVGALDRLGVDLFQPCHQREMNGLRLRRASAEHEQRLRARTFGALLDLTRVLGRLLRRSRAADRIGEAVRIDDHDHRAIAQDGVAAEQRDVAQPAHRPPRSPRCGMRRPRRRRSGCRPASPRERAHCFVLPSARLGMFLSVTSGSGICAGAELLHLDALDAML